MSILKTVLINYCVCAFFATLLETLVAEKQKRIFKTLSFCVIAAVTVSPLFGAQKNIDFFDFLTPEEEYSESQKSLAAASGRLEKAVYKNVEETLINEGINEYEIYVSTNLNEEENTVTLSLVSVQIGSDFKDKAESIKQKLSETYGEALALEVKNNEESGRSD